MMKIAHSTIRYFPAVGGVEDYVKNLCLLFDEKNYNISIVTTNLANHQKLEKLSCPKFETLKNHKIYRHNVMPINFKGYMTAPKMLQTLIKINPDIIHAHSYMYSSADIALTASKLTKKPLIFNPYLAGENNPSLFGKIYRKIFGNMLMQAECVITISPYEKELIHSWNFKYKRIEKIPPGIDLNEFDSIKYDASFWDKYNINASNKIFTTGRIAQSKGLDILVNASAELIKKIDDICFIIAGPDFGHKQTLIKMIKEKRLEKYFKFIGSLNRHDLVSAYKHCDFFVFPSRFEAFGIVAAEAMAAKKAVIGTNYSAIPNVISENGTGLLFEKENYHELAEKILYLIENKTIRDQMGNQGYNKVKEKYSWKNSFEKLEKVYNGF